MFSPLVPGRLASWECCPGYRWGEEGLERPAPALLACTWPAVKREGVWFPGGQPAALSPHTATRSERNGIPQSKGSLDNWCKQIRFAS